MKLSTLMREYIDEGDRLSSRHNRGLLPESFGSLHNMPVEVAESNWKVLESPERLARKYSFKSYMQKLHFLEEIFAEEERTGHTAKITIDGPEVTVEVWTHDLDRVTELDKEYAGTCDMLYKDITLMGGLI